MDKIDFKKTLRPFYGPTRTRGIHVLTVPPMRFLMVDGRGDPNTDPGYGEALAALYGVAYRLKAASKVQLGRDYVVPPLEGLWWSRDWSDFSARRKAKWHWTMMIMVPDWIGPAVLDAAIKRTIQAKTLPGLARLRVELLEEGRVVQALHVGPYDSEGPLIARMHGAFMEEHGFEPIGKHHEVYLSDPRKCAPERLRTILRQPVRDKA